MKRAIMILSLGAFLIGCMPSSIIKTANRIDNKTQEYRAVILGHIDQYEKLKADYIEVRRLIYGKEGEAEMWQFLLKNRPDLAKNIIRVHKELVRTDRSFEKVKTTLNEAYLTWGDFKKAITITSSGGDKVETALNLLTTSLKLYKATK